ncbi:MAG: ribosomal protein S18-alanine N-acetyltransferase [Vampirovibrionales bacterium]|nr:ribosomal protein S18-alanine N-acetyltransferase [Vampirovibrionales bacterium]
MNTPASSLPPPQKPVVVGQPSELAIRRMRPGDVAQIMPIESVSFGRQHWSDESFVNEMNNVIGRYYVLSHQIAPDTEKIIGYAGIWLVLDEAHLTTIAVSPDYRGQSLGELLLVHTLDYLMGRIIHSYTLEVRSSNTGAQALYLKYGFEILGLRPKYYQDTKEDGLIMTIPNILDPAFRVQFNQLRAALVEKLGGALPVGCGL